MDSVSQDMSEPIDFSLQLPTLKELSFIRIARSLWRTREILKTFDPLRLASISQVRTEYLYNERTTEKEVLKQIQLLPLPEYVIKRIKPVIHYVGRELFEWLEPFEKSSTAKNKTWPDEIFQNYTYNDRVCWTGYGTVDATKMAKMLLREDVIPIGERFELSCKLCLEDEIARLWAEMGPEAWESATTDDITVYWSCKMKNVTWNYRNPLNVLSSPEECIIEQALVRNYPTFGFIFERVWPKLSPAQQERLRPKIQERLKLPNWNLFGALFSILNTMGCEQQLEVLRGSATEFIQKFLTRPWQHLLFPTLTATIDHINKGYFFGLLHCLVMDQCDDYTRSEFYSALDPLIRKYVHNNDEATLDILITRNSLDLVKTVMAEAPDGQKLDLIARTFPWQANPDKLEILIVLVNEWVSDPDTWSILKTRLMRKCGPNALSGFEAFFECFDNLFANKC